jgi:thiamine transport system ATP-binding protein
VRVTLDVRDVSVAFDGTSVLDRIDLTVAGGEVLALLGPSGSGKSTLLRVIAGLLMPDAGRVLLDGRDITTKPTHRRGIGMVFQDEQLFPHRDVHANIAFGLRMQRRDRAVTERRVAEMLELVGLSGFDRRTVTELSGGEAKRVALARSLAPAPNLVLLDEPLTGLDRDLHDHLAGEVGRILRAAHTTAILVTHDPHEAAVVADRVIRLDGIGGRRSRVVELAAADTHPLRRAVLREGRVDASVVFEGDDEPGTLHLGLEASDGTLVGVSTWLWRPCPREPGDRDRQLRGMAVDTSRQAGGFGAVLLAAGVERAIADGATTVWANARDTALGFYERHRFEVLEPGHVDAATGLAHHHIRLVGSRVGFPIPAAGDTHGGCGTALGGEVADDDDHTAHGGADAN